MKKIFLLILVVPFLFNSCSDNNNNIGHNQYQEFSGLWQFERMDTIVDAKGEGIIEYIKSEIFDGSEPLYDASYQLAFDDDGIFSYSYVKDGEPNVSTNLYEAKNGYLYITEGKDKDKMRIGHPYSMKDGELHINRDYTDYMQTNSYTTEHFPNAQINTVMISCVFVKTK